MSDNRVFVSTGGAGDRSAYLCADLVIETSPHGVELSGGIHVGHDQRDILLLAAKRGLMLHNYFPPPEVPFVLNLAEPNEDVATVSVNMVERALEISAQAGAAYFGVHAGALVSPRVEELGGDMSRQRMMPRHLGREILVRRLRQLGDFAESLGVRLLVENHALTESNLKGFGGNPLLMAAPQEIEEVMAQLEGKVGLLLDVGHLNVSARAFELDPYAALDRLNGWTEGYHLSRNDGTRDSHSPIDGSEWFWGNLDSEKAFYTCEIHSSDVADWIRSADITSAWLNGEDLRGSTT